MDLWPTFPTMAQFKAWARIADEVDDAAILDSMGDAQATMSNHLRPLDPLSGQPLSDLPGDLRLAFYLRVMRDLARRNSPEGLVGFAEFGAARIARVDVDVAEREAPYARIATVLA
jgi:hypothetical protein